MFAIATLLNQHTTADFVTPALQGECNGGGMQRSF
tara:strand:+ start:340 stop:444 length:105 start_codon:yes stop_codon:yes gene_type:complete